MEVRIEMTVEVDPDIWMLEYGVTRDQVENDVREWIENAAATAPVPMVPIR